MLAARRHEREKEAWDDADSTLHPPGLQNELSPGKTFRSTLRDRARSRKCGGESPPGIDPAQGRRLNLLPVRRLLAHPCAGPNTMRFPNQERFLQYCVSKRRTYLRLLFERRNPRGFFELWNGEY